MLNIILFGAPGCGKGTQAQRLAEHYDLYHISTGEVIRSEIKRGTELGKSMEGYISRGELAPDSIVVEMVRDYMRSHNDKGCIFGRAVSQWCVIDFEKRMPVSLEEVDSLFEGKFCDAPSPCDPPRKVLGVAPQQTIEHKVVYSDIDFNRHVNTMRYIVMMIDMLPIEYMEQNRSLRLDVHFMHECRLGQVLTVGYEQRDNVSLFEIKSDDGAVACRASIEWR